MAVTITSIRAMSASLQVRYVVPPMYSSSHYTHTSTVRYIVRVPFRSIEAELCVCVRGNTRLVVARDEKLHWPKQDLGLESDCLPGWCHLAKPLGDALRVDVDEHGRECVAAPMRERWA